MPVSNLRSPISTRRIFCQACHLVNKGLDKKLFNFRKEFSFSFGKRDFFPARRNGICFANFWLISRRQAGGVAYFRCWVFEWRTPYCLLTNCKTRRKTYNTQKKGSFVLLLSIPENYQFRRCCKIRFDRYGMKTLATPPPKKDYKFYFRAALFTSAKQGIGRFGWGQLKTSTAYARMHTHTRTHTPTPLPPRCTHALADIGIGLHAGGFDSVLLVQRAMRDNAACAIKYGEDWGRYTELVPYPGVAPITPKPLQRFQVGERIAV